MKIYNVTKFSASRSANISFAKIGWSFEKIRKKSKKTESFTCLQPCKSLCDETTVRIIRRKRGPPFLSVNVMIMEILNCWTILLINFSYLFWKRHKLTKVQQNIHTKNIIFLKNSPI